MFEFLPKGSAILTCDGDMIVQSCTTNIQDLHLESLRRVLETEETRKGDSFEAVGIKFPSETTRWAGFVVLCGIQVYFALLLQERPLGVGPATLDSGVAWIGLYSSAAAKALLFVTIVLLPTFAFTALAFAKGVLGVELWQIIGLVSSTVAILALSVLTWINLSKFRGKALTPLAAPKAAPEKRV